MAKNWRAFPPALLLLLTQPAAIRNSATVGDIPQQNAKDGTKNEG
jgi:hypothetical protein